MNQPYSQGKALWAITKASFKAIFNHPTAIVFSLLFPIIFILIFGAFGGGGPSASRIAITSNSDTTGMFFKKLRANPLIRIVQYTDSTTLNRDLERGRLAAVVTIRNIDSAHYTIQTRTTSASDNTYGQFRQVLQYLKLEYEIEASGQKDELVHIPLPERSVVRKYRQIDFILPGQLGFSILFSTLFGIAFTFFGLREQLVLKRFYASPVSRVNILLGIGISRLFFQLMNVMVLILFGHFFLDFTLQNGLLTFLEMVLLSVIMLFLLMGVGLIFSSVVKSDTTIPLLINLFGFPQMLLSGTFFPVEVFPKWLQQICQWLPLTQFNNGIRKISFEGLSILECWKEIGIMGIWMVIIYAVLARVIRWQ